MPSDESRPRKYIYMNDNCSRPAFSPDKAGNIVILRLSSVAPLEFWEWGINSENQPYERYQWCEDDFFEDSSFCKTISWEELLEHLRKNGADDLAEECEKIREMGGWKHRQNLTEGIKK